MASSHPPFSRKIAEMYGGVGGWVSAAVPAAAASVLVTSTPADAKPMRTGMRSNFGMYLTVMLLSVVDRARNRSPATTGAAGRKDFVGCRLAGRGDGRYRCRHAAILFWATRVWLHVVRLLRRSSPRRIR